MEFKPVSSVPLMIALEFLHLISYKGSFPSFPQLWTATGKYKPNVPLPLQFALGFSLPQFQKAKWNTKLKRTPPLKKILLNIQVVP